MRKNYSAPPGYHTKVFKYPPEYYPQFPLEFSGKQSGAARLAHFVLWKGLDQDSIRKKVENGIAARHLWLHSEFRSAPQLNVGVHIGSHQAKLTLDYVGQNMQFFGLWANKGNQYEPTYAGYGGNNRLESLPSMLPMLTIMPPKPIAERLDVNELRNPHAGFAATCGAVEQSLVYLLANKPHAAKLAVLS